MPRRDLNVTIDGDSRGFQRASKEAQRAARDYERELNRINARMVLFAKVGASIAPPVVSATAAAAAGMGAAATAAGTLAAAGGTVALAMGGLGEAMDALSKAHLNPTQANLESVAEALQQLAPAGRDFVLFLDTLRPQLEELQAVAQAGLLPGVEQGIRDAMVLFPELRALVATTSVAMGQLAEDAGAALTDPFWQNYISFLGSQAAPTIQSFGAVLGNLAEGFAGVQMAFGDLSLDMGNGLEDLSEKFSRWGRLLGESQGFRDFVSYAREVTPEILDTVGQLARTLGAVAEAAAPVGPVTLEAIQGLANILEQIASIPGVGTALFAAAAGLGALNTATKALDLARHSTLVKTMRGAADAGRSGGRGLSIFNSSLTRMALGIGGIWALTEALQMLDQSLLNLADADVSVAQLERSLQRLGQTGRESGAMAQLWADDWQSALARSFTGARRINSFEEAVRHLNQPIVQTRDSLSDFTRGLLGLSTTSGPAERRIAMLDQTLAEMVASGNTQAARRAFQQLAGRARQAGISTGRLREMFPKYSQAAATAGTQTRNMHGEVNQLHGRAETATPAVQTLANKYGINADQARRAYRATRDLDTELSDFFDLSFGVQEAQDRVTQGWQRLKKQVKDGSAKLRGNSKAAVANREQLRGIVRDTGTLMAEEALHADSLKELKNKTQDNIDRFKRYAERIGLNEEQVKTYTEVLKDARIDVINKFKTEGLGKARSGVVKLTDKLWELDGTYAVRLEGGGLGPKFEAEGGPISGPGGPRDDKIPAMLSNGENVWSARDVQKAGGQGAVEGMKRGMPRFADGGPARADVNINARPLSRYVGKRADYMAGFSGLDISASGSGAQQWADEAAVALAMLGQSTSLVPFVLKLIGIESGGNPNAINLWDINAQRGMSSGGLIQVIPPTFQAYRHPGLPNSRFHPLANLYAGLNYGLARYGSLTDPDIYVGGYDRGGVLPPGVSLAYNGTRGAEHKAVFTSEQWRALQTIAHSVNPTRVTSVSPVGGDGSSQPLIGSLTVQTTPQATAGQIINEALHQSRVVRAGGR